MEDHVSLPKRVRLTDGILREVITQTGRSEIETLIGNIEKKGLDHFFGMKPRLSKVVKERIC